jgi:hypothetical protein
MEKMELLAAVERTTGMFSEEDRQAANDDRGLTVRPIMHQIIDQLDWVWESLYDELYPGQ